MKPLTDETISATDANRHFSEVLRRVREGRSVTVTSHGIPIADIIPHRESRSREERERAHREFVAYLRTLPAHNIGTWTRDELYDDDVETPV